MSKVYSLSSKAELNDEACLWVAKLDRGLSNEETLALKQWVATTNAHADALYKAAELWDKMDDLSRLADIFEAPKAAKPKRAQYIPTALAASLAAGIIALGLLFTATPFTGHQSVEQHANHQANGIYETAIGEQSIVNLSDTSVLTLNTNTKVSVSYTEHARILTLLRGELHIKVAHNKNRPLSVIAQDKLVQAVGTAFNVQIMDTQEVELIVTDGKVLVAEHVTDVTIAQQPLPAKNKPVTKGQKLIIGATNANITVLDDNEISANLSWQQGNLIFKGETLAEALVEIERYTSTEFEIKDASIANIRIAGMFKAGDIDGLTLALKQNFNIDAASPTNQKVILTRGATL